MTTDHHLAVPAEPVAAAPERRAGRANLRQLIELRWLAVGGQLATVLVVHAALGIVLPWAEMLSLLGILVAFNLFSLWRNRLSQPVSQLELCIALIVDVGVLTGQLYLAGGSDNPFISSICCRSPSPRCCCGRPICGPSC